MAGDPDELVGSDEQVDVLTEPSQKRTYQDYWNAAYRGLVPGGLNRKGDSSAPALPTGADDAEPFSETDTTIVEPAEVKRPDAQPVIILDDLTRVVGSVERYFRAYQVNVGAVGTTQIVNRDSRRTKITLVNGGPGDIYLGDTESIGLTGFIMPASESVEKVLGTTRGIWAQQEGGQASTAIVYVLVEYDKEI